MGRPACEPGAGAAGGRARAAAALVARVAGAGLGLFAAGFGLSVQAYRAGGRRLGGSRSAGRRARGGGRDAPSARAGGPVRGLGHRIHVVLVAYKHGWIDGGPIQLMVPRLFFFIPGGAISAGDARAGRRLILRRHAPDLQRRDPARAGLRGAGRHRAGRRPVRLPVRRPSPEHARRLGGLGRAGDLRARDDADVSTCPAVFPWALGHLPHRGGGQLGRARSGTHSVRSSAPWR